MASSARTSMIALATALLLVAAACGSTVDQAQRGEVQLGDEQDGADGGLAFDDAFDEESELDLGAGDAGDAGSSAGPSDDGRRAGTAAPGSGGGATAGGGGAAGESGTGGAGSQGDAGASTAGPAAREGSGGPGPGVTDRAIHVGILYAEDGGQANEAIGFESSASSARDFYDALLDDVNSRGGVLGREVVPVYYRASAVSAETFEQQLQSACAHWHEDNEIFGLIGLPMLECTAEAGGVAVFDVLGTFAPSYFAENPAYAEVAGMTVTRQARATIEGLRRQGYLPDGGALGTGSRVGILSYNTEGFVEAVEDAALPALARHGIDDVVVRYIEPPASFQAVGESSAQIQNAVLRFRSEGVTHLIILEGAAGISGGGFLLFTFSNSAESQGYRARYGLNSGSALNAMADQAPAGQLEEALAVGWVEPYDIPERDRKDNASVRRCAEIMKRNNLDFDGFGFADARRYCDNVFFFEETMRRGGSPTRGAFIAGVNSIGTSYTSTLTFATRFAPDQHDGVAAVRNVAFGSDCRCWSYTSGPYRAE